MIQIDIPIPNANYTVFIQNNILSSIENFIDTTKETIIITDDNIPKQYIQTISPKFPKLWTYTIPHGEQSKSMEMANLLLLYMLENQLSRSCQVLALGGGVVGDLAGFVSSIYKRGVSFIQVPTTLLSQIDSSVGGKTGVNTPLAKNSIGSFKQPSAVIIDPTTLETLPKQQLSNGIAEMIKYAFIRSKSLYKELVEDSPFHNLEHKIKQCIEIKRDIVLQDTFDTGIRQILNFGHTFGHAIEQDSNYQILHGEAVGIGMLMITKNIIVKEQLQNLLSKYNLPTKYDYKKDNLYNYVAKDKKISNQELNIVLVEEIGNGFIKTIKTSEIYQYM